MRLVIIEDECVIRNGLTKHVPWRDLGIAEVRAAANAEEAFVVCEEKAPDVVLSDIRMPGMDGITLCRRLQERYPDVEIIFATGYENKEYLKAAIDLHVVGFLEKPVSIEQLSALVQEAVKRARDTRKKKRAYLRELLLNPAAPDVKSPETGNFCVGMFSFNGEGCIARIPDCLERELKEWLWSREIQLLVEVFDPVTVVFLLSSRKELPGHAELAGKLTEAMEKSLSDGEKKWFLAFGKAVQGLGEIAESYQSARGAQKALAYLGWSGTVFAEESGEEEKEEEGHIQAEKTIRDRFAEAVFQKEELQAKEILDQLVNELKSIKRPLNSEVRYLFCFMGDVLKRAERTFYPRRLEYAAVETNSDYFLEAETYDEIYQEMVRRMKQVFLEGEAEKGDSDQKSTFLVKKVMDYILEHYSDTELSIKTLAEHVYLTPTYLSGLFKKHTGITIGQYLVDVRIEHAKRLMKDPQLKFYQVAAQVGYEDANYFAKIFKKKTGTTPSEYKESLQLR